MNIRYILLVTLLTPLVSAAQSASEYISPAIGSSWKYQQYDLDSTQHILQNSGSTRTDSIVGATVINARTAYVLKTFGENSADTALIFANADSVSFYNEGYPKRGLKNVVNSLGLGFIPQAPGWYSYFKFKTPPQNNVIDTLYRKDTTIVIDSVEFPLTLIVSRLRRPAGTLTVPAGTFGSTTPFELSLKVDTWIATPLGKFAVPLLKLTDTMYVAKNNWIVKEIQGSTYFPLSKVDNDSVPKFTIPGFVRLLERQTIASVEEAETIPLYFNLQQNYPNPFNGMTNIEFDIERSDIISLNVTDILGREIQRLVDNHVYSAGTYRVQWNSGSLPSGIYFYELRTQSGSMTKKMIIQK